jgi:SNF2 family DNA or RNA helicase
VHPEIVLSQIWLICPKCKERNPIGKRTDKRLRKCGHPKAGRINKEITHEYPKLFDIEWGAIIIDESHESLIVRSGEPTQRRIGLENLKIRADGMRILSSGTPFDSKPHQLWGSLNWLDPVTHSAFHRWAEMFWQKGGYTGHQIGEFRKDREQMLWDSLDDIAIRKTKAEVAPDLPPKMHIGTPLEPADPDSPVGIWLPMEGKQAQAYADMEALSVAELDSGRLEAVSALAELTRLKQLASCYGDIKQKLVRVGCGKLQPDQNKWCKDCKRRGYHMENKFFYVPKLPSNKFDWVMQSLEEWGYPKNPIGKVVIVSFFTGILEEFGRNTESHFRTPSTKPLSAYITGKTPSGQRRSIIDQFNAPGGPQLMFLNVKAGGTAITIDSADRMIMVSETRVPTQQTQAEDRIHRVSNPRQCMYYYLRSLGTVDVGTALVNQEALRDTHRLLDTRRGVDYARHVIQLSHIPIARGNRRR